MKKVLLPILIIIILLAAVMGLAACFKDGNETLPSDEQPGEQSPPDTKPTQAVFDFTFEEGQYTLTKCYPGDDTKIIIPSTYKDYPVSKIGERVFEKFSGLIDITIPTSVTSIGEFAFNGCNNLNAVYINDIAAWCDINFENNTSNPLNYAEKLYLNNELVKNLIIPESVTSISDFAFRNYKNLTNVTMGNAVKTIGLAAFQYCSSLTSITIPNSVTSIGGAAFQYCSGLTSVTIPNSVTSIGEFAFNGCDNLNAVYISDIAAWCNINFENNTSNPLYYAGSLYLDNQIIEDLIIPESVTSISECAFQNCDSLKSVTIGNAVKTIGLAAFYDCVNLAIVSIGDGVTNIGERAFDKCSNIESITIPTIAITSIPQINLKSVVISSGDAIGENSFVSCKNLTDLIIGDSVISINKYAFAFCDKLTNVIIGDSVTNIGERAFVNCGSIKSVTIPDSVNSIGSSAFNSCSSLTSITMPNSVTSIGKYAFNYCNNLNAVYISDIAAWCDIYFENSTSNPLEYAEKLYLNNELVENLIIPETVTSISELAFVNCTSFTNITIPNSVTSIGNFAFSDCSNLNAVYISDIAAWCNIYFEDSTSNPLEYAKKLYLNNELVENLIIPESVTSISRNAFLNCTSFTSVTIGDNVTDIYDSAFLGCSNIAKVYFKGNSTEWDRIHIFSFNEDLKEAARYYYSETQPTDTELRYWHYGTDGVTIIEW